VPFLCSRHLKVGSAAQAAHFWLGPGSLIRRQGTWFDIAFEQIDCFRTDPVHDRALGKKQRIFATVGPKLWSAQIHAHESRAQLIKHLPVYFMAVAVRLPVEAWQRLAKGRKPMSLLERRQNFCRRRQHACVVRVIAGSALVSASASSRDSLHRRCLARSSF
jgi:hypothetical protein